jgi:hypothetical protein
MANVQEVHDALHKCLDSFEAANNFIKATNGVDNEVISAAERCDEMLEWSRTAVDCLADDLATHLIMLSYIVIMYFDGEYIFSPYDLIHEIQNHNYFCKMLENNDGSFEISAYREAHE